jgi:DNA-binding SARP family transcriptional activator
MNDLEISTLGGLEIRHGGAPVSGFTSRKVEALLVYLACTRRPHSRDVLADLLWDDLSQSRAMGNLRVVLHSLRQQLGSYVEISRDTVALNPESTVWLDVAELEENLDAAQGQGGLASVAAAKKIGGGGGALPGGVPGRLLCAGLPGLRGMDTR